MDQPAGDSGGEHGVAWLAPNPVLQLDHPIVKAAPEFELHRAARKPTVEERFAFTAHDRDDAHQDLVQQTLVANWEAMLPPPTIQKWRSPAAATNSSSRSPTLALTIRTSTASP
jgi:hypothetical protein